MHGQLAQLGTQADAGKRLDVLAVLADASARDAFNGYLAGARDLANFAGLEVLTPGAAIYDRVTVTRR